MAAVRSKRFWVDPRFAIGLVLIVVSVAGTAFVVTVSDATVEVVAARATVMPGERLDADDVVVRKVAIDDAKELYLTPDDIEHGVVITRVVGEHELVPRAATGDAAEVDDTTIVLPVKGELSAAVQPGAVVDVWVSSTADEETPAPPRVIAAGVTVARLVEPSGLVVSDADRAVEVLVPRDDVGDILGAVTDDASVSVVPAGQG